jgi:hypothetical protein
MVELTVAEQARAIPIIESVPGVVDVRVFGERMHVRFAPDAATDAPAKVSKALENAGLVVSGARDVQASLEDVFIARLEEAATQGR